MAMDLERISHDLERALENAREIAEQHRHASITAAHLLYVILSADGLLFALLKKSGAAVEELMQTVAAHIEEDNSPQVDRGRRPTASAQLRKLVEKSFEIMNRRGGELAEPVDFLLAIVEADSGLLSHELREAGVTKESIQRTLESRTTAAQMLGGPSTSVPGAKGALMLEKYGRDLTQEALAGQLMPVVGRDHEIRQIIQTLLRKSKNNPVLVGDPGTGKTAIAEALAQRIADGDVPDSLKKCRVVALDLSGMIAGAKYRGEFEERLKGVIEEVRARKGEIVLFLDEIHTLVGAGGTEGGMDAANILKPALARGELRCLGATTFDEYREKIEKDGALARRFDIVTVKEPDDEMMVTLLRGIRPRFEAFHGVTLTDEALQATVKLSRRYLRTRCFPDKAIDVIDQATARIRMQKESKPTNIDEQERLLLRKKAELAALQSVAATLQTRPAELLIAEIDSLEPRVTALVDQWQRQKSNLELLQKTKQAIQEQTATLAAVEAKNDVAAAAEIRYGSLKYLEQQLLELESATADNFVIPESVLPEHIAEIVAETAGIPSSRMLESERERLLKMEERIAERVFGQDEAIVAVAEASRRMRADLQPGRKPNSFLFVGPTGVGKTELAKALAEALFDDEGALIRIDMGEYKDQSSISGLIGSRPGLVGSDQGGRLTEQVRRNPYSIVLFDEIEKGAPEVLDLLLGVLDEGRLSDAKGRFCDFSNTTVIFTSNLGVREAIQVTSDSEKQKEIILDVVKRTLRPELFNRIGQVITFNSLDGVQLESIVGKSLTAVKQKLKDDRSIDVEVDSEALQFLAAHAYDPAYGARPVQRTLQQLVLSPLATVILSGDVAAGQTIRIRYEPQIPKDLTVTAETDHLGLSGSLTFEIFDMNLSDSAPK